MDVLGVLQVVAAWTTPIVQILAIPTAIVTFIITVRRVRRWMDDQAAEQEATKSAATAAKAGSEKAAAHAATAGEKSDAANEAIVWLAGELAKSEAITEGLRERVDRLLGTRARELAAQRASGPSALLIPRGAGDEHDPVTATGKHRLHTQHIPALDEGDHP